MPSIMIGLVTISLGLWGLSAWWWSMVEFLRGAVPLVLLVFGCIALGAGVRRLREANATPVRKRDRDAGALCDLSSPSKPEHGLG
ncbi:MAG: hypothetical protein HQL63_10385 [Magnetococcales bacterium]|nr:hypothetical protein [Magnetococcales bacterium]